MIEINLGNYIINLNKSVKHEKYFNDYYHGVIIYDDNGGKYDIINNYAMGYRLIVDNHNGFKDMPFKESTFCFLPVGVEVKPV